MSSGHKLGSVAKTLVTGGLSTLTLFVTSRCNARCSFCFNWKVVFDNENHNELTLEEYSQVSAKLGPLPTLIISGGEPFMRKDLPEILASFVRNCGTHHISIPTNAMTADTVDLTEKIIKENPDTLIRLLVGVDGLGADHDNLRGVKGGFQRMDENVTQLLKLSDKYDNLGINAVSVYSKATSDTIYDIADWVHKRGFFEHKTQIIRGSFPDSNLGQIEYAEYEKAIVYIKNLFLERLPETSKPGLYSRLFTAINRYTRRLAAIRYNEKRPVFTCTAGQRILIVRETGDVFVCELLAAKLGNLRECDYDILSLTRSDKFKKIRKQIKDSKCSCSTECNAILDVVYNPRAWWQIVKELF